jgi:putative DNA primase/helicase
MEIYPVAEFTEAQLAEGDEWLVDGIVPAKGHVQIYGQEGHGKSWGGLELAVCIATGGDWFGHKTTRPAGVLYVATERARTTAKRLAMGYDEGYEIPNLFFTEEEFYLDQPQTVAGLGEAFKEQGIEVLIFDTAARNHATTQWRGAEVLNSITKLQHHQAVVLINHTMKGSNDSYGGGHMLNSQDVRIRFTKLDDNVYDVECVKISGAETWEPFQFAIQNNRPQLIKPEVSIGKGGRQVPGIALIHSTPPKNINTKIQSQ